MTISTFAGGITNTGTISAAAFATGIGISAFAQGGGAFTLGLFQRRHRQQRHCLRRRTGYRRWRCCPRRGIGDDIDFRGGVSNTGTIVAEGDGVLIGGAGSGGSFNFETFTGGILNSGVITGSGAAAIDVLNVSEFLGGVVNSGKIAATVGIEFSGATAVGNSVPGGGVTNVGTISTHYLGIGLFGMSTFTGDVVNAAGGKISARSASGIEIDGNGTVSGGVTNAGLISAGGFNAPGIRVLSDTSVAGDIVNASGGIVSAYVGVWIAHTPTFAGGVSNGGTISASDVGIQFSTVAFAGGASASGGIVNTGTMLGNRGIALT